MGIYDREYYQEENPSGFGMGGMSGGGSGTQSLTVKIIIFTSIVYLVDEFFLTPGGGGQSFGTRFLALHSDAFSHPWKLYQLLTSGFMHAPMNDNIFHIVFNMFCLFMFGRVVEQVLGPREYLLFYLTGIVAGGLCWLIYVTLLPQEQPSLCIGASAGVTAVIIYFCLKFPNQQVFLFGVFGMPAWVLGVLLVGTDVLRSFGESEVAWQGHLGGAGFAFLYVKGGFRLERIFRVQSIGSMFRRRPKLKVHNPDKEADFQARADELLQKVHELGEESLTGKERRMLEEYSRRMRQKHR